MQLPSSRSVLFLLSLAGPAAAQGPETALCNYDSPGQLVCPCFVSGEQAGAVLEAPADDYPIEITKIRLAWSSQFGGSGQTLESSLNLYGAGLPNPGTPQFSVAGPALTDGFVNEFDITAFPGDRVIEDGPFTVTLTFLNTNAGDIFSPSVVFDGTACQSGKNVIFAIPGGWTDACVAGVSGDWVFEVSYRKLARTFTVNGSGANPVLLTSPNAPVLGTTWNADLDCTGWTPNIGAIFGYSQPAASPIQLAIGELLINPGSAQQILRTLPHGGGVAAFSLPVPPDVSICGDSLFVQGACFGDPGTQLTNRLDIRAGS